VAKKKTIPEDPKFISFETFRNVTTFYYTKELTEKEPSCFNSMVRIKKYRVTIEEVEEPKEVLCERLEKLWREADNWHNRKSLEDVAESLGYTFTGKFGQDINKE